MWYIVWLHLTVLIVASCSRMFDIWPLKKCWFDFFRKTCGYPSDIHL